VLSYLPGSGTSGTSGTPWNSQKNVDPLWIFMAIGCLGVSMCLRCVSDVSVCRFSEPGQRPFRTSEFSWTTPTSRLDSSGFRDVLVLNNWDFKSWGLNLLVSFVSCFWLLILLILLILELLQ
jgi:hypothetical protein